ncbi:rod shape-determining protein MreC [Sphingorhabdus sp.]|jgi:rod shape-determining protein MreC|uniref:rod shape-determining protein MreC n=1 Tax=Sphingorhabdus sp. TaxID=1902408 RepID=UPI0035B26A52|nr:rod shape-determining protein MreC [Sphingomonadaceae bacterium]
MAPPRHRRPGFSRRAQYSLFVTYVLAIAGAVVAGVLLLISIADPTGFAALRAGAAELTAPVARGFHAIRRSIAGVGENTSAYLDAASQNAALKRQVAANRTKLIEADALRAENAQLKMLLNLQKEAGDQLVAIGNLVSSTASSSRRIAILSVGSSDGVAIGYPVRAAHGLVGRVIETSPNTAKVLLLSDAENVIPVIRVPDGLPALANGLGDGTIMIRPVDLGVNNFKRGQIVVTSGSGGLYPPNIPFASIVRKTSDGALARPIASPASSEHVMVLKPYQEAAKQVLDTALEALPKGENEE